MRNFIALALAAATGAVCGAVGDGVSLEPVKIFGRDYWTLLESGPYADPGQKPHAHWENPDLSRYAFLRDCGVVQKTSRWDVPPEGGSWRTVRENCSSRDSRCWNAMEANAKHDKPLVTIFSPKGRFGALMGPNDLDMEDYRAWKARHPNLIGLRVLSEWGNNMASLPRQVKNLPDSPLKEEWTKLLSRYDFNDRYSRLDFARWYTDRKLALNYGDGDLFMAMRSWVYLDHVAAAWGAKTLFTETTDSTGNDAEYRWDISAMFGRGASRQFARPWVWYTAIYLNGFSEDGRWLNDSSCRYFAIKGNQHPDGGYSQSLQRRSWYYAYLTGASGVEQENWAYIFLMTNAVHRKAVLSPRGENFAKYHDFTRAHPNRGAPYAPVAVLVPFAQGYRAMGGKAWGTCPYLDGDYAVDSVFFTLAPGWQRREAMRTRGAEGCLHNSPFAFMYDVLVPDSPQEEAEFVKVLSRYPAAILVGEYRDEAKVKRVLTAYTAQGGRLLRVTPDMLPPNRGDDTVWDIVGGKIAFPKVREMLRGLQDDYFPFEVEGDVAYGANRTKDGWWLWCLNNKGVTKYADKPERVDPSAAAKLRIRAKAGVDAAAVCELVSGRTVEAKDGVFEFTVPSGDVAVFEIGSSAEKPARVALPGEPATKSALPPFPFPDRMSAFVWRNWFCVPVERMAKVVGAKPEDLSGVAAEMGLPPQPAILPEWRRKGYITVVRRNWHLLDYDQLTELIDMTREEFAVALKEDDFLFHKLGSLKPKVAPLRWSEGEREDGRGKRKEIAQILKKEGIDDFSEEPRFQFVKDISATAQSNVQTTERSNRPSPFNFRMIASYFADYGDPLADREIGSFPEGLLQKLAAEGVNAVWMHVVLNTLVKDRKYPEFGVGSETRIANLKRLVERTAKYGIKVYLYLNEPRCLRSEFFAKAGRDEIRGVTEDGKGITAMCTSSPETRRWLRDSLASLFSQAKGLGGVFTITMSENLTSCASHRQREGCPRCKGRSVGEIIAEVNATVVEGVTAGDPDAEVIVWNWSWPTGIEDEVFPRLPKRNCRVMAVSENGMPVTVGDRTVPVHDYSISQVGPGENALRCWDAAKRNGLPVVAKVQACSSWELSPFPYIPVLDLVDEHARKLSAAGVDGVMLSWSCGSAPTMNLRPFGGESLDEIARSEYGEKAVAKVRKAWTAFSEGFRRYPFEIVTLYKAPQQWGPANPLYPQRTGYSATMVGFPYDDLCYSATIGKWDMQWCGRFRPEPWIARFEQVRDGFEEGCRLFAEALGDMDGDLRARAVRDLEMFRAQTLHFRSVVDQSRFVMARDRGDRTAMRALAVRELEAAKRLLPIVRGDSRIGYECSNHYYYIPQDVREKILGCIRILKEDRKETADSANGGHGKGER